MGSPRKQTGLLKVRKATGLTQPAFADLCGLSFRQIQSLEGGQRSLTMDGAIRIQGVTGAAFRRGKHPAITGKDWTGGSYTPESFAAWRQWSKGENPHWRERQRTSSKFLVGAVVDAMASTGRGVELKQALMNMLGELLTKRDRAALVRVIKEHAKAGVEAGSLTVGVSGLTEATLSDWMDLLNEPAPSIMAEMDRRVKGVRRIPLWAKR